MAQDFTLHDALTLQMISIMALDELRAAATHRRLDTGTTPVFLGLVRPEQYWKETHPERPIRTATKVFPLGRLMKLFDDPIDYTRLQGFETLLCAAIWMLVADLHIVDGDSFVKLPESGPVPVYAASDNLVALLLHVGTHSGVVKDAHLGFLPVREFHVTAAVV